ncbi:MAG: MBL fold metallo-hydrolase [Maribacter sp.]
MRQFTLILLSLCCFYGCKDTQKNTAIATTPSVEKNTQGVAIIVLGTAQDAGSPHIACKKECCATLFENEKNTRKVVSLGVLDYDNEKTYLFEATPDITSQVKTLKESMGSFAPELPNGIFLTHAHIGHYTGLMYLGKEATNASKIPVFAMPKMTSFLEENGPWGQLVTNENIALQPLTHQKEVSITNQLKVVPFTVPHREEYSETVGYRIIGPNKSALFIPDINKWSVWETPIEKLIAEVDYAFLDATFYDGEEINTRDISEIPHPFVIESMDLFQSITPADKKKIFFIHFNHTNPLLQKDSPQTKEVLRKGFQVARKGMVLSL